MTTKILLDTDIGSDIDDAVCLAYLLANPNCDLLGITTVTGEGQKRAQLASALCKIAGKDVPIHVGAEKPFLVEQRQPTAPQAAALDKRAHATDFSQGSAVTFMRETIRANPGEVILLTIGPLTNIGLLFTLDPEIPTMLKGLVMMCGVFVDHSGEDNPREWNAMLDPHATAIAYRNQAQMHRSIGLDVTRQVTMDKAEVKARFRSPLLRAVYDFAEIWFEHTEVITFHDPLAAATIFDEGICKFTHGRVAVELGDPQALGQTRWTPDADGPHQVALEVDAARFFEHYFGVFN